MLRRRASVAPALLAVLLLVSSLSCFAAPLPPAPCESEALERWHDGDKLTSLQSGLISQAVQNGWWLLATEAIKFAQDEGIDIASEARSSIASVQREVAEITKLLENPANQMQTLSPAFQWAESKEKVYMRIKLAYRWSSPGALVLDSQNITLLPNRIFFSGVGTHSNIAKLYKLDIALRSEIIPEESEYTWGAVGQMLMTLKKAKSQKWGTLLHETEKKLSNAQMWWEMHEILEGEEAKAEKAAREAREKTAAAASDTTPANQSKSADESKAENDEPETSTPAPNSQKEEL